MEMKARQALVLLNLFLVLSVGSVSAFGEINLKLEVTETTGNWNVTTPMFLNTTDDTNPVSAYINATNISPQEPLEYLQYLHWIFYYHDYTDPSELGNKKIHFYQEINFTSGMMFTCSYMWLLHKDVTVTYTGTLKCYFNNKLLLSETEYGYDDTYKLEIHLWRAKSDQLLVQWKLGNNQDRGIGDINPNWNVNNFSYSFYTVQAIPMDFCVTFEDFGYHCGTNEGISDPVSNENWGIFEPIRQILLFILNLFMGLIDLILPERIEKVFHNFLDNLSTYIDPFLDIIVWLGANWLDLLVLIHVFLIIRGIERAAKGDIVGFLMPLLNFYGTIFNITMKIINFVVSIIKAVIEALPF